MLAPSVAGIRRDWPQRVDSVLSHAANALAQSLNVIQFGEIAVKRANRQMPGLARNLKYQAV
jgi:hypothetical protein